MKLRELKECDDIQLIDSIQGTLLDSDAIKDGPDRDARTYGRDVTVAWIEENITGTGRWPVAATTIEDELEDDPEYDGPKSRQHITNCLEGYYQCADTKQESSYGEMDSQPFSASPQDIEPQPDPDIEAGENCYLIFIENGEVSTVTEANIPDGVDIPSYIQGILATQNPEEGPLSL